jgi:hypothetical protein
MPQRLCSILGTLSLAFCIASGSPALAQKKKADDAADTDKADEGKADEQGAGKPDKPARGGKKKKGKKAKAEEAAEEKPAEGESSGEAAAAPAEETVWERPPADDEKPKPPPPKPVAAAKKPGGELPWSAGLLLGYGFKTDRNNQNLGADPYGFVAGLRGGYTLEFNLYVGLYFDYYLGSSETGDSARINTGSQTSHANYIQFGAEVGYDWWVGPLIVRPSMPIGAALAITDVTGQTDSVGAMVFAPGLMIVTPIDEWFIGGDGRFVLVTGDGVSAFKLAATAGLRF